MATIPVEQIKPGMTGYGLTVFSGFKVERFEVQVIDVVRQFLPKQDLILARIDHPVVRRTGVVGGMSGSPIYLQGKLAGALAYGWRFTKEPVCGITPIANMLDLLQRKPRGMPSTNGPPTLRVPQASAALNQLTPNQSWWRLPFLRGKEPHTHQRLAPVAVPINVAGFSSAVMGELHQAFSAYGFEPVQGGGTGKAEGPPAFENGGSVAVQLVSGDMSMAGTGTVTWSDGKKVLGFGHRMFNAGEIYIPVGTARINHTLANVARSFKIASPARILGSLVQDRQAGILATTEARAGTVPFSIDMRWPGQHQTFNTQLARHPLLTPTLVGSVLSSALQEALSDATDVTFTLTTTIQIKGFDPIQLEDHLYGPGGVALPAVASSRALRVLQQLMVNDFAPVELERVAMAIDVAFATNVVEITGVNVHANRVDPGSRLNLTVTFRPFGGKEFSKSFPLEIPAYLAGSVLKVEVASGDAVKPDRAPPETFKQYLDYIQDVYSARSVVVSVGTPDYGLKIRGHAIQDLPASAMDSLVTGSSIRAEKHFNTHLRQVHATKRIIAGKRSLRLRVRSEVNP